LSDPKTDLVAALRTLGYSSKESDFRADAALACLGDEVGISALLKMALNPKVEAAPVKQKLEVQMVRTQPEIPVYIPQPQPPSRVRASRTKESKFHWKYFILLGWWLAVLVLLLRFTLMGIEALYHKETREEPAIKALFGWW